MSIDLRDAGGEAERNCFIEMDCEAMEGNFSRIERSQNEN